MLKRDSGGEALATVGVMAESGRPLGSSILRGGVVRGDEQTTFDPQNRGMLDTVVPGSNVHETKEWMPVQEDAQGDLLTCWGGRERGKIQNLRPPTVFGPTAGKHRTVWVC